MSTEPGSITTPGRSIGKTMPLRTIVVSSGSPARASRRRPSDCMREYPGRARVNPGNGRNRVCDHVLVDAVPVATVGPECARWKAEAVEEVRLVRGAGGDE